MEKRGIEMESKTGKMMKGISMIGDTIRRMLDEEIPEYYVYTSIIIAARLMERNYKISENARNAIFRIADKFIDIIFTPEELGEKAEGERNE